MFALPPRLPKNHILKDVTQSQASSDLLTPSAPPRATQTTIAKFPYPLIDGHDRDDDQKEIEPLNAKWLTKLVNYEKASWVENPGANAPFVHSIHKQYSLDYYTETKHKSTHFVQFLVVPYLGFVFQPSYSNDRLNTSLTGSKR